MKKIILLLSLFAFQLPLLHAQQWFQDMYNPSVNFFTVQQEFNTWWAQNKQEVMNERQEQGSEHEMEGKWVLYKRWEHQVLPAMVASGGIRQGAFDSIAYNFNKQGNAGQVLRGANTTWNYIGPQQGFAPGGVVGCKGRLNCVRFDPVDSNTIYVGAPSGGIWKTTDAGQTWALLNTDTLAQIGVTDIAINPNNTQNIFIATGDFANDASFSIGVLQSTNGGLSWSPTGLSWTRSQGMEISRLLMNPLNSDVMLAATNNGIYKTINAGATWTRVSGLTEVSSMEFKPGNANIIYACNTRFYQSVNGGNSFNTAGTGLPSTTGVNAMAIGVTPADTNCVYVLTSQPPQAAGDSYDPIGGLYRSENGGSSFALQSVASSLTTQGIYDLNVGVSPINSNVLVIAAVYTAYSDDGGLTFNYPDTDAHVDHHDIRFFANSASKVYSADDGGLFISTDSGNIWSGINNGLNIGQIYIVAPSARTGHLDLSGRQDDGTLLQVDTNFTSLAPGDGTSCAIDPTNDSIMYGSIEEGIFAKSTDFGHSYQLLVYNWQSGINGAGNWITPFLLNPQNHNSLYIGKDKIYKSVNGGATWVALNSPALSSGVYWNTIEIAPSDTNFIYATADNKLARSVDDGATFTNIVITDTFNNIWSMVVSPVNPAKLWAATSYGVFLSIDSARTWTNISNGLPPLSSYHPYSIVCLKNSPDAIYLGLYDGGGVYYRDSTLNGWIAFGTGLPNTSIENLEISYAAGTIRAATYGRDLWESALYSNWYNPPVAQFQWPSGTCAGQSFQLNDASSFSPTSWQWTFTGGNPSSSNEQNPVVSFPTAGIYNVTLTAANSYGSDTVSQQLIVGSCTGIEPNTMANAISVYPNPACSLLTAQSEQFATNKTTALVYDIAGRLVKVPLEYVSDKILLHIDDLSDGTYWLKLQVGENTASKIFVKTR